MKDRIEVNGVWYVKETIIEPQQELDPTVYKARVYETDDYTFEASRIYKDDSEEFYEDINIEVTDKSIPKNDSARVWYIDNPIWLYKLWLGEKETRDEAEDLLTPHGLTYLLLIIKELINIGWLKHEK